MPGMGSVAIPGPGQTIGEMIGQLANNLGALEPPSSGDGSSADLTVNLSDLLTQLQSRTDQLNQRAQVLSQSNDPDELVHAQALAREYQQTSQMINALSQMIQAQHQASQSVIPSTGR